MTYNVLVAAAQDATWKLRVKGALLKAAIDITVDSPAAGLETRRDALAREILLESDKWTERFALPVALGFILSQDLTTAQVNDSSVNDRVSSVFNDFLSQA